MTKKINILLLICFFFLSFLFIHSSAKASETNGTIIGGTNIGYAWSSKVGWYNFATTNGGVNITDSGITGYIWNQNTGWVNMNPTNGGVDVSSSGALSGYAWGSDVGWVSFSGASINSSGEFTGSATGSIVGTLSFDCTNCDVRTDFRPLNNRTTTVTVTSITTGGGGGGGGIPADSGQAILSPIGGFGIIINGNNQFTPSPDTTITLIGGLNTDIIWLSNAPDFSTSSQVFYQGEQVSVDASWNLDGDFGEKTVYARFCTQWGVCSGAISDSIIYTTALPISEVIQLAEGLVPVVTGEVSPTAGLAEIGIATEEGELPAQLFDIRLLIDDNIVPRIDNLVARVAFASFGRVPTPVEMTFSIIDSEGNEIWKSSDATTVQTEAVFIKRFFDAGTIPLGNYTLRLNTLYNENIKDTFEAAFTIAEGQEIFSYRLWGVTLILFVIISWLFSILRRRKKKEKIEEKKRSIKI